MTATPLRQIGRSEQLDFPELQLLKVPAKTDTGAFRSAVHANNIRVIEKGGSKVLQADILDNHPNASQSAHLETKDFSKVTIENSFGVREQRYEVKLLVTIAGESFTTTFSLADRSKKPYPVLLGRKLLNKRFLVDSSKSTIDRRGLRAKLRDELPFDVEEEEES